MSLLPFLVISFSHSLSISPEFTYQYESDYEQYAIEDFDEWVKLDLEYIENWSFLLDFKIAVKTVSTVLSGTGM